MNSLVARVTELPHFFFWVWEKTKGKMKKNDVDLTPLQGLVNQVSTKHTHSLKPFADLCFERFFLICGLNSYLCLYLNYC